MKLVYILSKNGTHKNYVKSFSNSYIGFGNKLEAVGFNDEQANKIKSILDKNLGKAFIVEDKR